MTLDAPHVGKRVAVCCCAARRLVLLALLACWLAMSVLKVQQYISEPTSTSTHWQEDDQLPAFTVCPARAINRTVSDLLNSGSLRDRHNLLQNKTLLEYFWLAGLRTEDMIYMPIATNVTGEFRDFFGTKWTTTVNYVLGGLCATATPSAGYSKTWSRPILRRHWAFTADDGKAYYIVVHGVTSFWGQYDMPRKQTLMLFNNSLQNTIIISTDRIVRESLRRSPCRADPDYRKSACQQQCFLKEMNCTFELGAGSGQRVCMASEHNRIRLKYLIYVAEEGHKNCSCPDNCVRDSYTISTTASQSFLPNQLKLDIHTAGIRKELQTTVSYTGYDLVADLGGFLGLFLGWSLLTLFELLRDGVDQLAARCRRRSVHRTPVQEVVNGKWHNSTEQVRQTTR